MKIAIIAGESFYKTSSFYIAELLVQQGKNEVFIFNKTGVDAEISGTTTIPVTPVLKGLLPDRLLQQKKIAALLKKYTFNKVLVFDADDIVKTKLPQVVILNNDHPVEEPVLKKLEAADRIIVFSETHRQKLTHLHPPLQEKVVAAKPVIKDTFTPQSYENKLRAKEEFAGEKEYFAFADFETGKEEFLNLLKAFSAFKKMQQSGWKLVVALRSRLSTKEKEELLKPLSNFKYRGDANVINEPDDETVSMLVSGAYALISTSEKIIYNLPVLEALVCNTPAIALRSEVFNDYPEMVLEATNSDPDSFAEKMMFLYKNENKRSRLSQMAEEAMAGFGHEANVNALAEMVF